MAEFPALPLFTDAYLADTRHLSAEQHGAYLLLLMCAWRTRGCVLKADDRQLARIVGLSPTRWRRVRPVLADFFDIEDDRWQQKKLMAVYQDVQARVARNRLNGARGGRAKAAQIPGKSADKPSDKPSGKPSGKPGGNSAGKKLPAKNQSQIPEPEPEEVAGAGAPDASADAPADVHPWGPAAAAAAGLKDMEGDRAVLFHWQSAGADLALDVLPTIRRLAARELAKGGHPPRRLAYYGAAVLDARDARLGATRAGVQHGLDHPPPPPAPDRRAFDITSAADWRVFLGDASSRFRGDYLSRNWRIGPDHPVFLPASLGPDPCHAPNPAIPAEIYATYAALWRWHQP